MQCDAAGAPLRRVARSFPAPTGHDLLIEVSACGVCRTDLHVADGEIAAAYPIVPGHEVVGRVIALGPDAGGFAPGDRVGVPWLGGTCGICAYCRSRRENLCDRAVFTGATRDGGYATHMYADSRYCLALPRGLGDAEAAPLLCAGLIGYRALTLAGEADKVALYGFGAAAHIIAQVAHRQGRTVYAVTRPADTVTQDFARTLGCAWAGGTDEPLPSTVEAALLFAPAGELVPLALKSVRKGGRVVCAGIHMSDIPSFPYADLWGERSILSVANLTRGDGHAFLALATEGPIHVTTTRYALADANDALAALRAGRIEGAAVLTPSR